MRHRVQGRKLGLPSDQRRALLFGQVRQLLANGHIVTTETRAKEVRRIAERLITLAREDNLANRRLSMKVLSTQTPYLAPVKPLNYPRLSPDEKARVTASLKNKKPERTGVSTQDFVHRLFVEVAPRFEHRTGGYTRIFKLGFRRGDAAPVVRLELVLES